MRLHTIRAETKMKDLVRVSGHNTMNRFSNNDTKPKQYTRVNVLQILRRTHFNFTYFFFI